MDNHQNFNIFSGRLAENAYGIESTFANFVHKDFNEIK